MEDSCSLRKRRSGLLNVWTVPSLEEAVVDSTMVSAEIGEEEQETERGREQKNGNPAISMHLCVEGERVINQASIVSNGSEHIWSDSVVW